jgi:hypothetical protein
MNEENKVNLEIDDDDAILIVKSNGETQLRIQSMKDDDPVPNNIKYTTALLVLSNTDEEFVNHVFNKFDAILKRDGWI